jgi:hypothetical protein
MSMLRGLTLIAAALALPFWAKEKGYTPEWAASHLPPGLTQWDILQKMGIKAHAGPATDCEGP